jgi:hypothetical protein
MLRSECGKRKGDVFAINIIPGGSEKLSEG